MFTQGKPLTKYSRGKGRLPTQIVLHESVTGDRDTTVRVLDGRHLSVHLIVDRDGSVTQHVPFECAAAHAEGFGHPSEHNEASIGIEVVNPYYGKEDHDLLTGWAHKGWYVVPPQVQLEAVWQAILTITKAIPTVPCTFPGNDDRGFRWGRWWAHEGSTGIMAHHRWAHADALFVEHYCWARSRGFLPDAAYPVTITAAARKQPWTLLGDP